MFGQRSFAELGTPLCDVTFCVVDLETTGVAPGTCAITEIGAVKYRGGERLGEMSILVNPGQPIPPAIVVLTGITDMMVSPAPAIAAVLPTFVEFAQGCVLVGHNLRFDLGFLNAALGREGYERLRHPTVCTAALARRLVRDDVSDCRLATLARHFRCPHQPTHRALADAEATADLLHGLLELAGRLGVLGLGDLLELPRARGRPHYAKIAHTADAPRLPGVYRFLDSQGRVLYVGKARDLRARVRSYFYGDSRAKVANLLREMAGLEWTVCASELEAEIREVREIAAHQPRHNTRSRRPGRGAYLALTLDEAWPRLLVVRRPGPPGRLYIGPLSSSAAARWLAEIVLDIVPLRRCGGRLGATPTCAVGPCTAAQLGRCLCPCSGGADRADYDQAVQKVRTAFESEPGLVLDPLEDRMWAYAAVERYEAAALARDRLTTLARALRRHHRLAALAAVPRMVVQAGDEGAAISRGRLVEALRGPPPLVAWPDWPPPPAGLPEPSHAEETALLAGWLDLVAAHAEVLDCDHGFSLPLAAQAALAATRRGPPAAVPSMPGEPAKAPVPAPG